MYSFAEGPHLDLMTQMTQNVKVRLSSRPWQVALLSYLVLNDINRLPDINFILTSYICLLSSLFFP